MNTKSEFALFKKVAAYILSCLIFIWLFSCSSLNADLEVNKKLQEITITDCIVVCRSMDFDYETHLKNASSGKIYGMREILNIGKKAHFDGAAASAHRNVLWQLFQTQKKTFIKAYSMLEADQKEWVNQRLTEALEDELR